MEEHQRFFISRILLPCPTIVPTLPTMQLDHQQFSQRFRCVMLVAANVAWSLERATEVCWAHFFLTPHPHVLFHFQTCSRRWLSICQASHNSLWRKAFIQFQLVEWSPLQIAMTRWATNAQKLAKKANLLHQGGVCVFDQMWLTVTWHEQASTQLTDSDWNTSKSW